MKRFNLLGGFLLNKGLIPAREREIVILRVGWNAQAVYEFGQHTLIGKQTGLTDDEIAAIAGGSRDGATTIEPSSIWPTICAVTMSSPTTPGLGLADGATPRRSSWSSSPASTAWCRDSSTPWACSSTTVCPAGREPTETRRPTSSAAQQQLHGR
ncbi:MAG: carboxymuconolactone decarboxylase family protein [Acidimicrobiales bacterium]